MNTPIIRRRIIIFMCEIERAAKIFSVMIILEFQLNLTVIIVPTTI